MLTGSYDSGMIYEFNGGDGVEYAILGGAIEQQWKWIEETSVTYQQVQCDGWQFISVLSIAP